MDGGSGIAPAAARPPCGRRHLLGLGGLAGLRPPGFTGHALEKQPGTNRTLCRLQLGRSRLRRFPHVTWEDALPETGAHADEVGWVCPHCRAAVGGRPAKHDWVRNDPRP